jgi:lysyl-tRNA synthetase class 2
VLACSAADRRLVLADASGRIDVRVPHGALPAAGDHVWVDGTLDGGALRARRLTVLTPHRGRDPFPSPGGEYYRLHRGSPGRAANLRRRSRCLAAVRAFFTARGYTEVQTPCRVASPGLEPHLRALPAGPGRYLITSPEYQMKRLLASGLERIYSLGPSWRGDELGPQHLTEFSMLEWYRAYCSLEQLMEETEQLLAHVAGAVLGGPELVYQGRPLSLAPPFERVTVARAFAEHAGVDLAGATTAAELRRRAEAAGLGPLDPDAPYEELASRVLVQRVEPALARRPRPVLLYDFPAPLCALSALRPEDPAVAARFELYAGGLELANAFFELTDPDEQRRRLRQDQRQRRAAGAEVYPLDERFLAALGEGIPPAAGIALGLDRLVMLLCDAPRIQEVVAFAPDEL